MSQTKPKPTTSRRALLASVPGLALGAAAVATPALAAEASADAQLIAACAAFTALWEQRERVWASSDGSLKDEERVEAEAKPLGDRMGNLARQIAKLRAVADTAKAAKAGVASLLAPRLANGTIGSDGITNDLLWSIVADLTGRPHPTAAFASAPMAAVAPQPSPDAKLLALCAEYVALDRAFIANGLSTNNMPFTDPRHEPLYKAGVAMVPRLHELEKLIGDIQPRTRAGLLAKAEAARRSLLSNGDDPEGGELMEPDSYLARAVIEDMLAVGGLA